MGEDPCWNPGDVIVFRGVGQDKIWYALPVYVVQDSPDLLVFYWPAGTRTKVRMHPSRERFTPADVIQAPMPLNDSAWVRTDVLMLIEPGAAHAIYVMWEAGVRSHLCWYCNLQDPIRRTAIGFDTADHWLDVVFQPDRSGWQWKDEDELAEAVAVGVYTTESAQAIRAEGERVIRRFEANQSPFCDGWEHWSPPPNWGALELPDGWDLGFRETSSL